MSDIDAQIAALQAIKAQQATARPDAATPGAVSPPSPPPPAQAAQPDIAAIVSQAVTAAMQAMAVNTPRPPPAPSGPPISDKGSPTGPGMAEWKRELSDNKGLSMSPAARSQMEADLGGAEPARRMRLKFAQESGATERIKVTAK